MKYPPIGEGTKSNLLNKSPKSFKQYPPVVSATLCNKYYCLFFSRLGNRNPTIKN